MKKVFFAFVVASVAVLAACNNKPAETATETATEAVTEAVTETAAVVDSTASAVVDSAAAAVETK